MPKLVQRLLVFFVGIPIVILFILPNFLNKLPFHILLLFFSICSCVELTNMLNNKEKTLSKSLLVCLTTSIIITSYLCGLFISKNDNVNFDYINIVILLCVLIIFISQIFTKNSFEKSNTNICNSVFVIIYSGLLPSYISKLTTFDNSTQVISLFVILVFISDSAAWLFGMLFGKGNRGVCKASPNKSIAGFIGAYLGSVFFVILLKTFVWKNIFNNSNLLSYILLAITVTTASIIGDLAESVIKRSSGCKDSGNIILGRGGALDSIDSILMAAPFYYIIIKYII